MQSMVFSVLLQNRVAVYMCTGTLNDSDSFLSDNLQLNTIVTTDRKDTEDVSQCR